MLLATDISEDVYQCLLPVTRPRSWDWIRENIVMPDKTPFDAASYPWSEGICDAWDDPNVDEVMLQFSARLGKTVLGNSLAICEIAHNPCSALFATSTEGLLKQTFKKKVLPLLRNCNRTRPWVPADHKILQTRLDLVTATLYGAWSGSPTTLADIDPQCIHCGEVDKWTTDDWAEGDPFDLVLERGIERPNRKVVGESTPALKGMSRINRKLVNGWNCRFNVQCLHKRCRRFVVLRTNKTVDPKNGGLWWDHLPDGTNPPPDEAMKTTRHICEHCGDERTNEYKHEMISSGIWVPEGMWLTRTGRFRGKQKNDGPVASFQMGRHYAPTIPWEKVVRNYVETRGTKSEQNHVNSWDGEVFSRHRTLHKWDALARRLCVDDHKTGVVPPDGIFLTGGVDVQSDHLVYMIFSWGLRKVGRCIAVGVCRTWDDLAKILKTKYPHADGGEPLGIEMTLIDSRHRSVDVKNFCYEHTDSTGRFIWPCEGVTTAGAGRGWRKAKLEAADIKPRRGANVEDVVLVKIQATHWEVWMDTVLETRRPGDEDSISFPGDMAEDQDLFEQLLNTAFDERKGIYSPIDPNRPWDFRDCARYARVAADVNIIAWNRLLPRELPEDKPKKKEPKKPLRPGDRGFKEEELRPWVRRQTTRRFG